MSKRTIRRIELDCKLLYHNIGSSDVFVGRAQDYSNSGVSFIAYEELEEGSLKEIHIDEPDTPGMPPLNAIIEIIRCTPDEKPGEYFVAGFIKLLK